MKQFGPLRPNPHLLASWFTVAALLASGGGAGAFAHSVSVGSTQYLYAPGKQSTFPTVQLKGEWDEGGEVISTRGQGELILLFTKDPQYLVEFPELLLGTGRAQGSETDRFQFDIGRKLHSWSRLDESWQLGIWQPRFRWDYVHPQQVGLTGAFVSLRQDFLQLTAFASPFFVPERGIPIQSQDGTLSSPMFMWFSEPSTRITIVEDQQTEVQYALHTPRIRDVVLQGNASFQARVGASKGPWAAAGYAVKPMNQVFMAFDGVWDIGADVLEADLHARTRNHHLISAEAGFEGRGFSAWFSALWDDPAEETLSEELTYQDVTSSVALSPGARWEGHLWGDSPLKLEASYLWQQGGNAPDGGKRADGTSRFEQRYPYQRGLLLGGAMPLLRRTVAHGRMLFDLGHQGAIYSAGVSYFPQAGWTIGINTDLFGTWTPDLGKDFISKYRANNRVFAGVSYAF